MRNFIRNVLALVIAAGLLAVPFGIIRVSYEIAFVGAGPQIEQLRSDMSGISGPASEDVIGQATAWNQTIRRMQAYNARWWASPFIPNAWDKVSLLPIPRDEPIGPPRYAADNSKSKWTVGTGTFRKRYRN